MTTCKPADNLFEQPFYTNPCSEVKEDHARHIMLYQYVACIRITNEWSIPRNDVAIWLEVPALVDILVGSILWNELYGFFKVVAFDKNIQRVKVQRKDVAQTKDPGTHIPSCTQFAVGPDYDV